MSFTFDHPVSAFEVFESFLDIIGYFYIRNGLYAAEELSEICLFLSIINCKSASSYNFALGKIWDIFHFAQLACRDLLVFTKCY